MVVASAVSHAMAVGLGEAATDLRGRAYQARELAAHAKTGEVLARALLLTADKLERLAAQVDAEARAWQGRVPLERS